MFAERIAASKLRPANDRRTRGAAWLRQSREAAAGAAQRVIIVRHGMGHHNDAHGVGSVVARDATLNAAGARQAQMIGDAMRAAGVLDKVGPTTD